MMIPCGAMIHTKLRRREARALGYSRHPPLGRGSNFKDFLDFYSFWRFLETRDARSAYEIGI